MAKFCHAIRPPCGANEPPCGANEPPPAEASLCLDTDFPSDITRLQQLVVREKICFRLEFFQTALTPPPVFLERFEELFKTLFYMN